MPNEFCFREFDCAVAESSQPDRRDIGSKVADSKSMPRGIADEAPAALPFDGIRYGRFSYSAAGRCLRSVILTLGDDATFGLSESFMRSAWPHNLKR